MHDQLVDRLVQRADALRLGDGLDPNVDVGPLINERQLQRIERYVALGKEEGAKLVTGGSRETRGACAKGWFYRPTIFTDVKPHMRIAQEEIFGPVLAVIKVASFQEAIQVLNDTTYGLSSSIYTRDLNQAMRAARDIETGITYINSPTIGAEAHLPFGGTKNSGNGHREGGWTVYDIFTEWQTVFVDYSGKLQKAQIDVTVGE
jgi:aldehyde dehydrogenase (NAD+)